MAWHDLAAGDLLIQAKLHALMWVGGEKPLVHNVDRGTFVGVIAQSTSYLDEVASCKVFRYEDPKLASRAAEFALKWATRPDQLKLPELPPKKVVLKTPYSHTRMEQALIVESEETPWTVEALFRALKALARAYDDSGLSPNHGVSCSQFATFCYQAAALDLLFNGTVPAPVMKAVRRSEDEYEEREFKLDEWVKKDYGRGDGFWRDKAFGAQTKVFRSLKKDNELIGATLKTHVEDYRKAIPKAVQVDAKRTTVEKLLKDLQKGDSGFRMMGLAKRNTDAKDAYMILE